MKPLVTLFLLLVAAGAAAHEDKRLLQMIEQLEARVTHLERQLGVQAGSTTEASATVAAASKVPTSAAPVAEAAAGGKVLTRYWLSKSTPFAGEPQAPLREGYMVPGDVIELDPKYYGERPGGLFDRHHDPSRYPVAAVAIEGTLLLPSDGEYRLVVKPTPPREVGGSGNVKVGVDIYVGGERRFSLPPASKLAAHELALELPAGRQPLRIEIVSQSPGFGPAPTRTKVFIGLQLQGAIAPEPISKYLAPDGPQ